MLVLKDNHLSNHLSSSWTTKTALILDVSNVDLKYQVFPNPAIDHIIINSPTAESMRIFNSSGKYLGVTKLKPGLNEISLMQYQSGILLLKLSSQTIKVVKR
ncbi:MAG: T9SS type A sorting domain-containing protein [Cyclobacteriaceae bacterium]